MAHDQAVRDALRREYVYNRQPLNAAAELAGITYVTARRWKKTAEQNGDNWDRARNATRMASGNLGDITTQVLEDFAVLFQSTLDDLKTGDYDALKKAESISRLSDSYVKTMKAAGGGDDKLGRLAIAIEVLDELANFIRDTRPELLAEFAKLLEPFGAKISEKYSK